MKTKNTKTTTRGRGRHKPALKDVQALRRAGRLLMMLSAPARRTREDYIADVFLIASEITRAYLLGRGAK